MINISNLDRYVFQSRPFPAFGNVEWELVVDADGLGFADLFVEVAVVAAVDVRWVFLALDLTILDELFFFGADAFQEGAGGFVGGVLRHELAPDGFLEDGFLELVGEGGVELFQFILCLLVAFDIWQ